MEPREQFESSNDKEEQPRRHLSQYEIDEDQVFPVFNVTAHPTEEPSSIVAEQCPTTEQDESVVKKEDDDIELTSIHLNQAKEELATSQSSLTGKAKQVSLVVELQNGRGEECKQFGATSRVKKTIDEDFDDFESLSSVRKMTRRLSDIRLGENDLPGEWAEVRRLENTQWIPPRFNLDTLAQVIKEQYFSRVDCWSHYGETAVKPYYAPRYFHGEVPFNLDYIPNPEYLKKNHEDIRNSCMWCDDRNFYHHNTPRCTLMSDKQKRFVLLTGTRCWGCMGPGHFYSDCKRYPRNACRCGDPYHSQYTHYTVFGVAKMTGITSDEQAFEVTRPIILALLKQNH